MLHEENQFYELFSVTLLISGDEDSRHFCLINNYTMRAKAIVDLLSLSVSLYMLSKDEEFLKSAAELTAKGKQKAGELYESLTDQSGEHELIGEIVQKAARLKEKLGHKVDEAAKTIYDKMHIAHTNEIRKLTDEIADLRTELALTEAKVINLQQAKG